MTDTITLPGLIRALGRGKKGSRNLTRAEAHFAMTAILDGTMTQAQLGALLMLMRVKEETPEEIAGFVDACQEAIAQANQNPIDINWPAYAGKKKQPSWYLLSAKLLAQNGCRILLHGGGEHTAGRQYARQVCPLLNIPVADRLMQAAQLIEDQNIAYISIGQVLPVISDLIDMKAELGLRSPVNTLVRHIAPLPATLTLQSMFHPPYMAIHHEAAALLEQHCNIVLKGDGGEFEVRPDSQSRVAIHNPSAPTPENLEAKLTQRVVRPETVQETPLIDLWNGVEDNVYGTAAVLQTSALVLSQLRSQSFAEAERQVTQWWAQRAPL